MPSDVISRNEDSDVISRTVTTVTSSHMFSFATRPPRDAMSHVTEVDHVIVMRNVHRIRDRKKTNHMYITTGPQNVLIDLY